MQQADIVALADAYDANEIDAREVVAGLTEQQGTWRAHPGSWSVAECLDHLATGNRVYLQAMKPAAEQALAQGRLRRGPARPGLIGGWFVRSLEPPVKPWLKMKAPKKIKPRKGPALADASAQFLASQDEVRAFLRQFAGVDLTGVTFPNPFVTGVRFSLATGLHVLASHQRRHLWQASNVREASLEALPFSSRASSQPSSRPASASSATSATSQASTAVPPSTDRADRTLRAANR
jgi:hypothetical protein